MALASTAVSRLAVLPGTLPVLEWVAQEAGFQAAPLNWRRIGSMQ